MDQHGCYSSKAYGENLGLEEWLRPISVGYDFHSILRRIIGRCADLCSGISHTLQENGRTAAASIFNKLFFPTFDPMVGTLLSFATIELGSSPGR